MKLKMCLTARLWSVLLHKKNKAWTNQLLENNNVPMIWLSNSVSGIDPAFFTPL